MPLTVRVPDDYAYVLAAGVSTFLVATWQGMHVSQYRKRAAIPYPYEYASYEQIQSAPPAKAEAMLRFNCAQRGHQNFNENHLTALGSMLVSGLVYPRAAAALGVTWAANRVLYSLGYVSGKPGGRGRYYGALGLIAHYVLIVMAGTAAWQLAV